MSATTLETLRQQKGAILSLAQQHGVQQVRVFGSVAREEDTEDSDIDLLISLADGRDLLDWSGFWLDVEDLLDRKVDVMNDKNLYWAIRDNVMADAIPL